MLPPPRELPATAPRLSDGRYVLLARIGKGGMAGVYAAWDVEADEWRAVKVLFPKHARDRSLRTRFENEAKTMQRLSHANLVRVFDVGHREKLPYLVMELVSAGSLYRWTKTHGAMPPRMAVEAMLQLCNGVEAVHQLGIVHRDIKPRNVLINWDGVLKLTDFGIAQLEHSQETRTGLAMGTLGFMSPEQLHDAKSVDLRTDVYAIGATLWAQVTARKARDLFRLEDKPALMDGVPDSLQRVLRVCLAYEREGRYDDVVVLRSSLEDVLDQLPEDPADAPPLAMNLGPVSLKSRPDNTFSEILTMSRDDSQVSQASISATGTSSSGRRPGRGELTPPPSGLPAHGYSMPAIDAAGKSAARSLLQDEGPLPSYMVGVEQPAEDKQPELIGYPLDDDDQVAGEVPRGRSRLWYVLSAVLLTPIALVLGAALTLSVVAAMGWSDLSEAAQTTLVARKALANTVQDAALVVDDLDRLGADSASSRAALFAFESAANETERAEHAIAFVEAVAESARPHLVGLGVQRSHEERVVSQRLERLVLARDALLARQADWELAAASGPGQLALTLDLASGPGDVDP